MKKIILYAASLFIAISLAAEPGSSLKQRFTETFPNAENIKWSDDAKGFFVSFTHNGNFRKAFYNKQSDFVCSWKYSDGSDLPINILMKLNRKFEGTKILGVTEYTTDENTLYNIKLTVGQKLYSIDMLNDGSIVNQKKYTYQK